MLQSMKTMLDAARAGNYAIGAFNVYNLEGVKAVIGAAEVERSPVMLQIHPAALAHGGEPLIALCRTAAEGASVPVGVHLDHSTEASAIQQALQAGVSSIMADGSHLNYEENLAYTRRMVSLAEAKNVQVEAELGRISGSEDGLTVEEFEGRYTDPSQAFEFVTQTGIHALAVCIGNVHGKYPRPPQFDFDRLQAIAESVDVPLVLHGASGVPDDMVQQSIEFGIRKFNVNTELRKAYISSLSKGLTSEGSDLLDLMIGAEQAMQAVIAKKIKLFGSSGKGLA